MSKIILIIEDDSFLQGLEATKLQKEGYKIMVAKDNIEAFKTLEETKPDLILLDLMLPGVDGFAVLKQIRESKNFAKIPVIVFSNLSEEKDIEKAKRLNISEFMIKSNFTLDELAETVKKLLKE